MFSKESIALTKPTVEAIKKISKGKWKWKPRTGQFVLYRGKTGLIDNFCPNPYKSIDVLPESGEFIPILHWEDDIERILEGMGYRIRVEKYAESVFSPDKYVFECKIDNKNKIDLLILLMGETRQEAVQKAVIKLAKEANYG